MYGSVCDHFEFLRHLGSHIPSLGVHVHAGYSCVSIFIHWTLTRTTGSLTCVHGLSYPCVYTRGLGTPKASQHNLFVSEKTQSFSWAQLLRKTRKVEIMFFGFFNLKGVQTNECIWKQLNQYRLIPHECTIKRNSPTGIHTTPHQQIDSVHLRNSQNGI